MKPWTGHLTRWVSLSLFERNSPPAIVGEYKANIKLLENKNLRPGRTSTIITNLLENVSGAEDGVRGSGMLERKNLVPIVASNAQAGFEQAVTTQPQLAIVDLQWPGTANLELCKQLRSSWIQTPIVVLSGIEDEIEKVLLLEAGADDCIVKL